MNCKFKIGDEVIISERANINASATGTTSHINQHLKYLPIYEVTYDKEQALTKYFLSYPYFENEVKLNITKIRDKILCDILEY